VPAPVIDEHPGRWIGETSWPSPRIAPQSWALNGRSIDSEPAAETRIDFRGLQLTGIDAGAWCMEGSPGDWPTDQRAEDGRSVVWDSAALAAPLEIAGFPEVTFTLSSDKPNALICVRLCDVAPDGCSKLVTRELLNLTHRESHESPTPLVPDERFTVTVKLDSIAHAFPAGHRLRVALSTDYWPWAWPSPEAVLLSIFTGGQSRLVLPVRPPDANDARLPAFAEPVQPVLPGWETLVEAGSGGRRMTRDVDTDTVDYEFRWIDGARTKAPDALGDITSEDHVTYHYHIKEGEPLSARSRLVARSDLQRGELVDVHIDTDSEMRSDGADFIVRSEQHVLDHGKEIFSRIWETTIPRDLG